MATALDLPSSRPHRHLQRSSPPGKPALVRGEELAALAASGRAHPWGACHCRGWWPSPYLAAADSSRQLWRWRLAAAAAAAVVASWMTAQAWARYPPLGQHPRPSAPTQPSSWASSSEWARRRLVASRHPPGRPLTFLHRLHLAHLRLHFYPRPTHHRRNPTRLPTRTGTLGAPCP